MSLFNKPEYSKTLVTLTRRMMIRLSGSIPILYNKMKNEQIFHEQNVLMTNTKNADVFHVLKEAIEYINPVLFAILKDEILREEVTKNAIPTKPDPFRVPLVRVLLLQEDKEPHLIAFGSQESCINDILDVLQISYVDKTIDMIPFHYFSLHYVIILKSKAFHDIFIEDCLVNNEPTFYILIMEFIQFTTKLLHFSRSSVVHAYPKPKENDCSHGCDFKNFNSSSEHNVRDSRLQQLIDAESTNYVPPLCSNPVINKKYAELMHMLRVAKSYHGF